jgi:hypothetical protein
MTKAMPGLAVSSDPNSPAIEGKIQSADDYPCNRKDGCRDVRIDKLIQVMEQEPNLIRLGSALASSQFSSMVKGHGQGSSSISIPQTREAICSQRRTARERVSKAPKTTHKMKSACRKRTSIATAE